MKATNQTKNQRVALAGPPAPKAAVCPACGLIERYKHYGPYMGLRTPYTHKLRKLYRCRLDSPPEWLRRQGSPYSPMPERGIHLI